MVLANHFTFQSSDIWVKEGPQTPIWETGKKWHLESKNSWGEGWTGKTGKVTEKVTEKVLQSQALVAVLHPAVSCEAQALLEACFKCPMPNVQTCALASLLRHVHVSGKWDSRNRTAKGWDLGFWWSTSMKCCTLPWSNPINPANIWTLETGWGLTGPGDGHPITLAEPRISTEIEDKSINFLVDMGVAYSVLSAHAGCTYPSWILIMDPNKSPSKLLQTGHLLCTLEGIPFTYFFLVIIPLCPTALLGHNMLITLGTSLTLFGTQSLLTSLQQIRQKVVRYLLILVDTLFQSLASWLLSTQTMDPPLLHILYSGFRCLASPTRRLTTAQDSSPGLTSATVDRISTAILATSPNTISPISNLSEPLPHLCGGFNR